MRGGSLLLFFALVLFFPSPPIRSGEAFSSVIFILSFSYFICFFGCSDGMEREACVCDHGFERSDLCAEIIIIIIRTSGFLPSSAAASINLYRRTPLGQSRVYQVTQ